MVTSAIGIVTSGMTDARIVPRKRKITTATRTAASPIVMNTASIERSMKRDESCEMVSLSPSGRSRSISGICSRSAALSTRGLAVACLMMPIATVLLPLKRTTVRSFSGPIPTRATSRSRTG